MSSMRAREGAPARVDARERSSIGVMSSMRAREGEPARADARERSSVGVGSSMRARGEPVRHVVDARREGEPARRGESPA
ncbi:hypothetical protein SAMN02745121_07938 [Nannocystis exedens]|uniref:Uncharacterized protein n=1 Tax=Nannocystis exedens TaxID=54 RepID=A0A1I2HGQ9_9BACT|nr:hypothetical protein [Nannocystis exedens]SFF28603.1 hypothetical protein SAMN02745121_07938 [Nannocystis exedens]